MVAAGAVHAPFSLVVREASRALAMRLRDWFTVMNSCVTLYASLPTVVKGVGVPSYALSEG